MYKVIKFFTDLQDNNHPYEVGDTFPREDVSVNEGRIEELATANNKQGVPLIVKTEEPAEVPAEKPKKKSKKAAEK